ncbi:hypothetical protein EPA93_06110 [Ktedonosporobacter rubrisoli]|uniref:FAD-binding domain-containing protein n=1 Tax=Ktedonosporobacter rubrisoli TaxID=2509675 RepID=A0A4P6JKS6_KTERU|nr:FAD-dependent monooxygenase [Ktedonosporobacter rubrisoli]QBD75600.1 hypothetical protein EPA93_06110 [Ktedonosporobacter rubrisoli]
MRVLISGGGVAGLTLAYWLHQYTIQAVVIEQSDRLRGGGYGIDFYGTGYEVAERMGIIERLRSQRAPFESFDYVNKSGKPIASLTAELMQKVASGKYIGLMHWILEEVLYETLADQVEVRFGRSLTHVEQRSADVVVTYNDGTSEPFDLLIGADGVHSNTRALVFGAEEQYRHFLGYDFASYHLADRYGLGQRWVMCVEPGRLAATYCSNQEGQLITFFMYQTTEWEHTPRAERLSRLRQVFAGMGWVTPRLLADAPEPEEIFMDKVVQIHMPSWHQGRVALVGDACDCPTFASGQGSSLAMGGAYLLAEALHECADYQEAFSRYEQQMKPYVLEQQKKARNLAGTFLPTSTSGILLQRVMLKTLLRESFLGLLRQQFSAPSILPARSAHEVRQIRSTT